MGHKTTKHSRTQPATLAAVKDWLGFESSETHEDAKLRALIRAATTKTESYCHRAWHLQTRTLTLDRFPFHDVQVHPQTIPSHRPIHSDAIVVPRPPLVAVTSITYVDSDGTTQTLAASAYDVDTQSEPGRITPSYNNVWPTTREQVNAVTITYVAGYVQTFTAAATDIITPTDQKWLDGDVVTVDVYDTGVLASGLSSAVPYHVVAATSTTLKVSATSGGSAVDLADTGTAPQVFNDPPEQVATAIMQTVGNWYENRESVITGTITAQMPQNAKWLLDGLGVGMYPGSYSLTGAN